MQQRSVGRVRLLVRRGAGCARLPARRSGGTALPIVLILTAMLLTLSVTAFETSTLALRNAANQHSRMQAFHAADAGLLLCLRRLTAGTAPVRAWEGAGEPAYWLERVAFDGGAGSLPAAFPATSAWPLASRAPQCLIEQWVLPQRPQARAYLITARGFSWMKDQQAWAQLAAVFEQDGLPGELRWRGVVARPY